MLVVIKGAGDIATGIALRLHGARLRLILTEIEKPTAIRRTVCFSRAVSCGAATVEGVQAVLAGDYEDLEGIWAEGKIPLLVDPEAACVRDLEPDGVVDAILAKRNLNTAITDAPVVVGVGPGFTARADCHAVVETMRGHYLGSVITRGAAAPNTGVPGDIGGRTHERIIRSPVHGVFRQVRDIGELVSRGDTVGRVNGVPLTSQIDGVLRGVLPSGVEVTPGFKCGDVDPRCEIAHCYTVSDKAKAVGGGVLEAVLGLYPGPVTLGCERSCPV